MYILSQIFVVLSDVLYISSMFAKKKNLLLALTIINNALFALHYFCLGEFTATTSIAISIIYLVIVYFMDKHQKNKYEYIPSLIFIGITLLVTFLINNFSFGGITSILSMLGVIVIYVAAIFNNLVIIKSLYLCGNILNFIVMIMLKSWFGAGLSIVLMISAVAGIIQSAIKLKKDKRPQNN